MNKNTKRWSYAFTFASIFYLPTAFGQNALEWDSLALISDKAENIQHFNSDDGVRSEVSYLVEIQYPGLAVGDESEAALKNHGWTRCRSSVEGWDSFSDSTESQEKRIHQNITYWSSGNRLLTIALRYMSPITAPDKCQSKPTNSTQHVSLILDQHTPENIEKIKTYLKIDCAQE